MAKKFNGKAKFFFNDDHFNIIKRTNLGFFFHIQRIDEKKRGMRKEMRMMIIRNNIIITGLPTYPNVCVLYLVTVPPIFYVYKSNQEKLN